MSIYVNSNNKATDMFINISGSKKKVTSAYIHGKESPIKVFGNSQISIDNPINNWVYVLDETNNIVKLCNYIGSETDVVVYSSYVFEGKTYKTAINTGLNATMNAYMFDGKDNIKSIKFEEGIDLSKTLHMRCMFRNCESLTNLDVSALNTSSIVNMASMFSGCGSLTSLDLRNWNTKKVTNMYSMFSYCNQLKTIYVNKSNWFVPSNASNMFTGCGASSVTYA